MKGRKKFSIALDKTRVWRRLNIKDRYEVMENDSTDEDWRIWFLQISPGLLLYARQWTHSRAEAEDIVQEAFVRLWRRERTIGKKALLFAAVRSIALDFWRRDSRRTRREEAVALDHSQISQPHFEAANEGEELLAEAVARLPAEQREVLVLKIWNDLTFADIASLLGIPQNTAGSRYRYALLALKKTLQPHG
jgi:RNA polymerase sigma-70 factor (ECF subfamily)